MTTMTNEEPAGTGYEICTGLISVLSSQLDVCEATQDPWAARYRYDAIIPFVNTMDEQIETLQDDAERETCREQFNQLIAKGRRIAPTIPLICTACGDAFTEPPPEEGEEINEDPPTRCRSCEPDEAEKDLPVVDADA